MANLYPMLQAPVLKPALWGGRRLADLYGKAVPEDKAIGESWELADHPHGTSSVANGPLAGWSLRQVIEAYPEELLGRPAFSAWRNQLPLMVKLIDAAQDLSIQVHPNEAYAARHGLPHVAKTECWVILHADPGARLITGVRPGVSREGLRQAAEACRLDGMLVEQRVRAGDVVFVPAGRLHAIGAGIVLAEFQQPSDTTYRVYDWGRVGPDGKPRQLHLDEAMECIQFDGPLPASGGRGVIVDACGLLMESLVECDAFHLERARLECTLLKRRMCRSFECVMIAHGEGTLTTGNGRETWSVKAGQTWLIPHCVEEYCLRSPAMTVLLGGPVER
jgi:mannose-6-phosphate isomerase